MAATPAHLPGNQNLDSDRCPPVYQLHLLSVRGDGGGEAACWSALSAGREVCTCEELSVETDTGQVLLWPRRLHQQPLGGLSWVAAQRAAPGSHGLSSSWTRASAPRCSLTWLRRVSEGHPLCRVQREWGPELLWDSQPLAGGAVSLCWVWQQNNGLQGALVPTLRIVTAFPDVAKARVPHALTGQSRPE